VPRCHMFVAHLPVEYTLIDARPITNEIYEIQYRRISPFNYQFNPRGAFAHEFSVSETEIYQIIASRLPKRIP